MGYHERDVASTARNWRGQSERYTLPDLKPKLPEERDIEKYDFSNGKVKKEEKKEKIIPLPPQRTPALAPVGD